MIFGISHRVRHSLIYRITGHAQSAMGRNTIFWYWIMKHPEHDPFDLHKRLKSTFEDILHSRMHDIPVVNHDLQVWLSPLQNWQQYLLGVLVTPWFMNIILGPTSNDMIVQLQAQKIGCKQTFDFPSGAYEFTLAHEKNVGPFWGCSLFSPMFDFVNQQAAMDTASAVLDQLMQENPEQLNRPKNTAIETPSANHSLATKKLSRRNLLTATLP